MPSALLCGLPKVWRWGGHGQMHSLPHCIPLLLYAQGHSAPAAACQGEFLLPSSPQLDRYNPPSAARFVQPLPWPQPSPSCTNPPPPFATDIDSPRPPVCAIPVSPTIDTTHTLLGKSRGEVYLEIVLIGADASHALLDAQRIDLRSAE